MDAPSVVFRRFSQAGCVRGERLVCVGCDHADEPVAHRLLVFEYIMRGWVSMTPYWDYQRLS